MENGQGLLLSCLSSPRRGWVVRLDSKRYYLVGYHGPVRNLNPPTYLPIFRTFICTDEEAGLVHTRLHTLSILGKPVDDKTPSDPGLGSVWRAIMDPLGIS